MKSIETPTAVATILNDRIVVVRARPGVEINQRNASEGDRLIASCMPGHYGQIIDRREDYSVAPVEVFQVLNRNNKLKAIAIVAHRQSTLRNAEIDKRLFKGKIAIFTDFDQARNWLDSALEI